MSRILISGSTGLIGSALTVWFMQHGSEVTRLVRPSTNEQFLKNGILWDVENRHINAERLEGFDAVIHLGGVNIAEKRWGTEYKEKILRSRVDSTRFLAETLAGLKMKPKTFLTASGVGYYGSCSDERVFDETTVKGEDYLADVCGQWERASDAARDAGIRVINMRLGTVLSDQGGALGKMLPIFKAGLGGPLGSGRQVMSWIALEEIPIMIAFLLPRTEISGPVNFVSPNPATNAEFTKAIGRALKRPAFLPVPAVVVKAMFGEMAEGVLSGAKVLPRTLQENGYSFIFSDIDRTVSAILS